MPSGNIYDAASSQLISYSGAPGPFVGATASTPGSAGVVPAPSAGDNNKVLRGDGTWGDSAGPVIAGVENTTTSTSVYASGDYVLVMGALYEVTSAIAIGDTLAPGINLSQNPTKVMTEITKVNQNLTLNYAYSSLPSSTTFNEFAQMVLEKLYPLTIDLNSLSQSKYTILNGTASFNPLIINNNSSQNIPANVRTVDYYDLTGFNRMIVNTSETHGYTKVTLNVYLIDENGVETLLSTGNVGNKTIDITSKQGKHKIRVYFNYGYMASVRFNAFKLEP